MSTKHLYTTTESLVSKSLQGSVHLNPSLRFHAPSKSVYYVRDPPHGTNNANEVSVSVSVISGGGAGHEPAHAGYTGRGMLSASILGDIFASPSAKAIGCTIRLAAFGSPSSPSSSSVSRGKDVMVVINNYTGDRLNFGLAIEKARVELGLEPSFNVNVAIDSVVVADDVSLLGRSETAVVGPRGLAGNILVCKILGAAAERGRSLREVKMLGDAVVGNLRSVGVGLDRCHVPGRVTRGEYQPLGEDELEVGLGLHNEPGVERKRVPERGEEVVEEMVWKVLHSDGDVFIKPDEDCVVFINNLGGMSQLEMGAVVKDVVDILGKRNINPKRILSSSYMTSLNAPGFSISLLNVSRIHEAVLGTLDVDVVSLIDDPTDAVAWVGATRQFRGSWQEEQAVEGEQQEQPKFKDETLTTPSLRIPNASKVQSGITQACRAVLASEADMTRFDSVVGDGDCGETFARGARAMMDADLRVSQLTLPGLIKRIGDILEDAMGGTIGALFAIFFTAWSSSSSSSLATDKPIRTPTTSTSLQKALTSLSAHTPAKPGDRTIMDVLVPFCSALSSSSSSTREWAEAVRKAREGAESTRGMKPKLGRAVYVGASGAGAGAGAGGGGGLPPDPGAWGVAAILEGFYEGYCGESV